MQQLSIQDDCVGNVPVHLSNAHVQQLSIHNDRVSIIPDIADSLQQLSKVHMQQWNMHDVCVGIVLFIMEQQET